MNGNKRQAYKEQVISKKSRKSGAHEIQSLDNCSKNNFHIQLPSYILHVKRIRLIPGNDLDIVVRRSMKPPYLRQTRDPGFYQVPEFIVWHHPCKPSTIRRHMRAGAHKTHVPNQYIKQLWELVYIRFSKKSTGAGYTLITWKRLFIVSLPVWHHTPEFTTRKEFTPFSHPLLNEKDRPPGIQLNQDGHQWHQPAHQS